MSNVLAENLRAIAKVLDETGAEWCLVGGLAVSARSEPRFTRDVDLAVAVSDDSGAESVVRDLHGRGWQTLTVLEHEAAGRLATVRFLAPHLSETRACTDLLFCSSGIEPEAVQQAEAIEVFPGLTVPVARIPHLLAMKVLAANERDRPQDLGDIQSLLREASGDDIQTTRDLLSVIERRGTHRGKALGEDFQAFVLRFAP